MEQPFLQHDNARQHTMREQLQAFDALLSPSRIAHHMAATWRTQVFICFPNWRNTLGGHDSSNNEVEMAVKLWFGHQGAKFSSDGHETFERWPKCVDCVQKQLYV
jgi:hypothetical protein